MKPVEGAARSKGAIEVEADGPIATVTINRPETRNALDRQTSQALVERLADLGADPTVRVVILRGAGGTFCSGDDLGEVGAATKAEFRQNIEHFQELTRKLRAMPQPVIASLAGHAQGGGLELALACDLRIAASDAQFACPEAFWGLTITNGSSSLLVRAIGESRAREMVLLGQVIDARTAERYGLVSRIVPPGSLDAATREWAERLALASAGAVSLNKRLINEPEEQLEAALRAEVETVMEAFDRPDAREGLSAFRERRRPVFPAEEAK
jgi:enoyl-CoA hydratase/carnithine racemase